MRLSLAAAAFLAGLGTTQTPAYRILVASESGDIVSHLRWDGTVLTTVKVVPVGIMPADIDGPHNVTASPDGKYWYVTIAHGTPYGTLWKLAAHGDTVVAKAPLEMFPTTIGLTPDGDLAFVANSDFHGDHPSVNVVTIVYTPTMSALTNLPACDMPHGVKVNHAGTLVYVSCMNSDEILEIDRQSFRILRRHKTGEGSPQAMAGMHGGPAAATAPAAHDCAPTFVSVSPDDRRLYVACNHGHTLQVLDAATLELVKEIPVGAGAYNVEPSADGRWVIVTNKKAQNVSLVDAQALTEVARIPTSKKLPHGVAYSPDGRWAFISVESIGTDPGAVDVIDLGTRARVASIGVPLQPTGITILQGGGGAMTHTTTVTLPPAEVLARAQTFFAERVPNSAAYIEKAGPRFVVLRGQGGEEVVFSAWEDGGVTRVRASTLFFDQAVDRFFSTLPLASAVEVA